MGGGSPTFECRGDADDRDEIGHACYWPGESAMSIDELAIRNKFFKHYCTPLALTEIGRTLRHSDVVYDRPIRTLETTLGQHVRN